MYMCPNHKLAIAGKININSKCYKCNGKGDSKSKCLNGYYGYLEYQKVSQEKEGGKKELTLLRRQPKRLNSISMYVKGEC